LSKSNAREGKKEKKGGGIMEKSCQKKERRNNTYTCEKMEGVIQP